MVRVSRPEGILRHIAFGIGIFFGLMGIAMLAMRLRLCVAGACLMTRTTLISQTTSEHRRSLILYRCLPLTVTADCIADIILSALPVWFLRDMKLRRKRKVLISSAFSATMVINIVTVVEAVMLFQSDLTSGSIIFEHVKVACSMLVCNLLVIVTFAYRILHKGNMGIEDFMPETSKIEFTTVDLELTQETSRMWSSLSGTTKSSTWSIHDSRSKSSRSIVIVASQMDVEEVEECR